ncbi:MAG: gamma-glutamyltransferase, partial [Deltaproteobacteria bacterium]|nr:gamma-glutamyltransferase [Deltaproteobacteria bacterium]
SIGKEEAIGEQGMVAANHPLASEVGIDVLKRGGNAVDAAVAMAFTLAVVEPYMNGIGGRGSMVIHLHKAGKTVVIDYNIRAPLAAHPRMYRLRADGGIRGYYAGVEDDENLLGHKAVGVPGTVAGLCLALERFGTLSLQEVMAPAIRYAEEGFPYDWHLRLMVAKEWGALSRFPETAKTFITGHFDFNPVPFAPADLLVQKDLATTLRKIAREGPGAFYKGEIAKRIAADMARNGGLITEEDLARYQPILFDPPLSNTYRGYRIVGSPGPTGSRTQMEMLNILEHFDLRASGPSTPDTLHLLIEAFGRAYQDTFAYIGDPVVVPVPWEGLLSKRYARWIADRIDPQRASFARTAGNPWEFQGDGTAPVGVVPPGAVEKPALAQHTTHLQVVDKERNLVSQLQTLGSLFGSRVVVPGTGILLNNNMMSFNPRPDSPNCPGSGKITWWPVTSTLVFDRDGQPLLTVGAPGGLRIVTAVTQVLLNVLDHDMGMQEAITAPRLHCEGEEAWLDDRVSAECRDRLKAMGHRINTTSEFIGTWNYALPLGILINEKADTLHGGTDIFYPGVAIGY